MISKHPQRKWPRWLRLIWLWPTALGLEEGMLDALENIEADDAYPVLEIASLRRPACRLEKNTLRTKLTKSLMTTTGTEDEHADEEEHSAAEDHSDEASHDDHGRRGI